MRSDVALFLTTTAAIAIVFLLVKYNTGSTGLVKATGNSLTGLYGTLITGNPQFYENAKGYGA